MKAIINLNNLVLDVKRLDLLNKLLEGAERQDYDYKQGGSVYYIKPLDHNGITVSLLPDDLAETQRLVWKLKQEEAANKT